MHGRCHQLCCYTAAKLLCHLRMICKCNASLCLVLIALSGCIGSCPRLPNFVILDIPPWGRRPQKMTDHLGAEDITKSAIVPSLPEDERADLLQRGILPTESSAKDGFCVMSPVKRGSPKLLPCSLCYNWCHIGCSYQTHLGRVCPCHVQILDPKRKIMVLRHPYHEDCGSSYEDHRSL